jgi:hypothetical protein
MNRAIILRSTVIGLCLAAAALGAVANHRPAPPLPASEETPQLGNIDLPVWEAYQQWPREIELET